MKKFIVLLIAFVVLIVPFAIRTVSVHDDVSYIRNHGSPNTVKGVNKNAKIGDYVLLKGQFIDRTEDGYFVFSDGINELLVHFSQEKFDSTFLVILNIPYYIWATKSGNKRDTSLLECVSVRQLKALGQ